MRNHFWDHTGNKMNKNKLINQTSETENRDRLDLFATYVIQSIIGQTDKQSVQPVQSFVTVGM